MKKILYLIIGTLVLPILSINAQSISGTSLIYKYEIFSEKAVAYKKAVEVNTINAYEQFLAKGYNNKNLNNQAKEKILALVKETNTIGAYENFLSKNYNISKLDNQAIAGIYTLTAQIDAVEGYRDFLKKYPNSAESELASKRLYEIFYAIAEEENDIASYYGFLINFPKSQTVLREKAYINMQLLEVENVQDDYNERKNDDDDSELKEKIARQLYVEAIRAKEGGDHYTFIRKYNTILYSDLFKDFSIE